MEIAQLWPLYYESAPQILKTLDLSRGESDFRQVYILDGGHRKLAVKHASNAFTDGERIAGWARLMEAYNKTGIYCPNIVCNRHNELFHSYLSGGRRYFVYAEEFARYETAEHIGRAQSADPNGRPCYMDGVLRSVGRVASMHFDFLPFPSGYCLLEPFCPPDATDEATECALSFRDFVRTECPRYAGRVDRLTALFFSNQEALRALYPALPVSCFQADLGDANILLDGEKNFAGLIDFNLSGKEPVLNYAVRAALWKIYDFRLYDRENGGSRLFWYDRGLDDLRMQLFLENLRLIAESYRFSDSERAAFPALLRYMNSFWWHHVEEIQRIQGDDDKIQGLLGWLERQMTRDDIALP